MGFTYYYVLLKSTMPKKCINSLKFNYSNMDIFGNHYVFNVKFEYDWNNEDYPKYYK